MFRTTFLTCSVFLLLTSIGMAQPKGFNYDESRVPEFTLPDPLVTSGGSKVTTAEAWRDQRRAEVLELFRREMFGRSPAPIKVRATNIESSDDALGGAATRKQIRLVLGTSDDAPAMDLLIYAPKGKTNCPTFLGLNFQGNHTVQDDPAIRITKSWVRRTGHSDGNKATEKGRGVSKSRWPAKEIVARGYALATIYYGDIDPDFDDGFKNGVHRVFAKNGESPSADDWGSIAAWAWGLSRAVDYFHEEPIVDEKRVAVIGHSRLGKTSLWAGAEDERFAIVISNNSGCGGAALSRRRFGETVKRINTSFPHWFCDNFVKYNDNENKLPLDQHMLIALSAPRPVYVASAEQDRWADPRGEFLSLHYAEPVYRLLGVAGVGGDKMPEVDAPLTDHLGYHIRSGKHDVTLFDWRQYMAFADKHFGIARE